MTPRFLAELLGRWCAIYRDGRLGEEEQLSKLTPDTGLLCQHPPPGQGLGDWLWAAHPEKWAKPAGDPSWGKKGIGEFQLKGTFLGGASQRGGNQ